MVCSLCTSRSSASVFSRLQGGGAPYILKTRGCDLHTIPTKQLFSSPSMHEHLPIKNIDYQFSTADNKNTDCVSPLSSQKLRSRRKGLQDNNHGATPRAFAHLKTESYKDPQAPGEHWNVRNLSYSAGSRGASKLSREANNWNPIERWPRQRRSSMIDADLEEGIEVQKSNGDVKPTAQSSSIEQIRKLSTDTTYARPATAKRQCSTFQHRSGKGLRKLPRSSIAKTPAPEKAQIDRERWQTQKSALLEKFGNSGWSPRKRLSPDSLEGIRALHAQYPKKYTTPVLADHFKVSAEAIRRILKSKWRPTDSEEDERRERWFKRGMKIWGQMDELGIKPPRKWRNQGIGLAEGGHKYHQ